MLRSTCAMALLLTAAAIGLAAEGGDELPSPKYRASLVCFNGKADSQSSCRTTLAITEGGLRVVTSKLTCGHQGAVSEITWTYRGREGGKDVYHVARKFPADAEDAKTTEAVVKFDGKRHVLFEDQSQCIVIELQPPEKPAGKSTVPGVAAARKDIKDLRFALEAFKIDTELGRRPQVVAAPWAKAAAGAQRPPERPPQPARRRQVAPWLFTRPYKAFSVPYWALLAVTAAPAARAVFAPGRRRRQLAGVPGGRARG